MYVKLWLFKYYVAHPLLQGGLATISVIGMVPTYFASLSVAISSQILPTAGFMIFFHYFQLSTHFEDRADFMITSLIFVLVEATAFFFMCNMYMHYITSPRY